MREIATDVGLAACQVIGGFVPRCQTGQTVVVVGYWTAAILIIYFGLLALIDRKA